MVASIGKIVSRAQGVSYYGRDGYYTKDDRVPWKAPPHSGCEPRPATVALALAVLRPLAQEHTIRAEVLFLIGLAATEASQHPDTPEADRDALLDEATASFRAMLIDRPGLVRVFFLKGEDSLSRRHFERVLAGKPPPSVAANVRRFLSEIRARRRWSMDAGFALAPDTNIGGNLGRGDHLHPRPAVPSRRGGPDDVGRGSLGVDGRRVSVSPGRAASAAAGADISRREYSGGQFDQLFVSVHAGPRWLMGESTEASLLANARHRWTANDPDHHDLGVRAEAGHRPETRRWRPARRWARAGVTVALALGFTVGAGGELRWAAYEGNWFPFVSDGAPREDRIRSLRASVHNRAFTLYGFSPQLSLVNEVRTTNAQLYDYGRTGGELRFVRQFYGPRGRVPGSPAASDTLDS